MEYRFNIEQILQAIYGPASVAEFSQLELSKTDEPFLLSVLGTPIFESIKFLPEDEDNLILLDNPIVDINRPKRIVKTNIDGGGTVKEMYGFGDYQVRIRGVLVNEESQDYPPYEKIQELNRIANIEASIPVESKLLNLLGIYNLAIERIQFSGIKGMPGTQPYVITSISDQPIELELREQFYHRELYHPPKTKPN